MSHSYFLSFFRLPSPVSLYPPKQLTEIYKFDRNQKKYAGDFFTRIFKHTHKFINTNVSIMMDFANFHERVNLKSHLIRKS